MKWVQYTFKSKVLFTTNAGKCFINSLLQLEHQIVAANIITPTTKFGDRIDVSHGHLAA